MPDGSAAVDTSTSRTGGVGRRLLRRARRTAHKMLCLIPMYRREAERHETAHTKHVARSNVPKAANVAATVPTARQVKLSDGDAVHRLLGDIKSRGLHATAGKIQLVHLDAVRRKFGARWPAVAVRAMDLAERVLRDRLDEGDIYTRYENFAFVVVFSMIDDAVAQRKAAAISSRIHDLLMTDRELAEVFDVKAVTARVDDLPVDGEALSPAALGEGLETAVRGREVAPIRGASALLGKLGVGYQPVYSVAERRIGIFIALPEKKTPDGEVFFGESAFPDGFDSVLTEEMDKLITDHVVNDLLLPVHAGTHRTVGTVISFYSLAKSARLVYRLGQLPDALRPRFTVEVVGVSSETPTDALAKVVRKLANVTGRILLRTGLLDGELKRFAGCGFHSIGCDLSHPDAMALPPGERDAAIQAFVAQAKAIDAEAHFYGLTTVGAIKTAIAAGAAYLSGDAIGLCTQKPQPVRAAEF
jgi:hypothetical protein